MKGVIVYADDDVLKEHSQENKLYKKFLGNESYTIIPVTSISDLEEIIKSVSPIRVLLLDWQYKRVSNEDIDADIDLGYETPENLLVDTKLFSLVYIFSRESLPDVVKERLASKYGNKIQFKSKPANEENVGDLYSEICNDINMLEQNNDAMSIAFDWSQRINIAQQTIFNELDAADPAWVRVLSEAARTDTGDAATEVVNMYQELLSEQLRQDAVLRHKIVEYNPNGVESNPQSIAKLYQRLIYSKVGEEQELMTGDICRFSEEYCIVITPECELRNRVNASVEILKFRNSDFMLKVAQDFNNGNVIPHGWYGERKDRVKENLKKKFSNDEQSFHYLPSFPFDNEEFNASACINFSTAFDIVPYDNLLQGRVLYRLNAPYIQQLRQRFLAFFGRYGVSALPNVLRDYNLDW